VESRGQPRLTTTAQHTAHYCNGISSLQSEHDVGDEDDDDGIGVRTSGVGYWSGSKW